MRIRATMMIQDPAMSARDVGRLVEDWKGLSEDHFLDGPVTPRVAIVDLDPDTGRNVAPARFVPPGGSRTLGHYRFDRNQIHSPGFMQVSVFGTVYRTIYLYEEPDALGRQVTWGFGAPQLLVVPRAGWWENAFYERRSHSLQFFSFRAGDHTVHTCLSRDIVSHETAHAILDGIAPDLYDALDPQSLALHEGIADLTAMLIAFRSSVLRKAVLDATGGSIENSSEFSSIGVEFGKALDPSGRAGYLRNLLNDERLDPAGSPGDEPEEHELSQVLTGGLYRFMCELHAHYRRLVAKKKRISEFSASGQALHDAAERFKRMVLRGLDYLPPGEVTFLDYARAILAADAASHPNDERRGWLRAELIRRGIARTETELAVETNLHHPSVESADLQDLIDSDWSAYSFADRNRSLLGIPDGAQFQVLPRLLVAKQYYITTGEEPTTVRELLFKVRWSVIEPNAVDLGEVATRRIQTGTTLVIDWDQHTIRAVMRPSDLAGRRAARDALLRRLKERGLVRVAPAAETGAMRGSGHVGAQAAVIDGVLRVHSTARLLHLATEAEDA